MNIHAEKNPAPQPQQEVDREARDILAGLQAAVDALDVKAFADGLRVLEERRSRSFMAESEWGCDVQYTITFLAVREMKLPCGSNLFQYLAQKRDELLGKIETVANTIEDLGNQRSQNTWQAARIGALGIPWAESSRFDVHGGRQEAAQNFERIERLDAMYRQLVQLQCHRS